MCWLSKPVHDQGWKIFPNLLAQEGAKEKSGKAGLRNWQTIAVGISEGVHACMEHKNGASPARKSSEVAEKQKTYR